MGIGFNKLLMSAWTRSARKGANNVQKIWMRKSFLLYAFLFANTASTSAQIISDRKTG